MRERGMAVGRSQSDCDELESLSMPGYKCYEFFDDVSDLHGPGHVACSASNLWCMVSADG
jgi:hypothetical protein